MKIPIIPGKYHQNCGFSMAMLVYRRVLQSPYSWVVWHPLYTANNQGPNWSLLRWMTVGRTIFFGSKTVGGKPWEKTQSN